MKPSNIRAAESAQKLDQREHLTSWKEIATYMGSGVRTVQRYEREFGLPIRRPTGKLRGSVIATRAEIDAWIAAGPIRETFKLSRIERDARAQATTKKIEASMQQMQDLKAQMLALRAETRNALGVLVDRVSSLRLLIPSSRALGYEPLTNMNDMDMDMDMDIPRSRKEETPQILENLPVVHHKATRLRRNRTSSLTSKKPH
ncbi:MAG TPA: hypothetical protein VIW67_17110 [Terriglobales bacterium]